MASQQETPPNGATHEAHMPREVGNFLIDTDDDECPDFSLHMAAFLGNLDEIRNILSNPDNKQLLRYAFFQINVEKSQIRRIS